LRYLGPLLATDVDHALRLEVDDYRGQQPSVLDIVLHPHIRDGANRDPLQLDRRTDVETVHRVGKIYHELLALGC
jgi:hypothetical protein